MLSDWAHLFEAISPSLPLPPSLQNPTAVPHYYSQREAACDSGAIQPFAFSSLVSEPCLEPSVFEKLTAWLGSDSQACCL